jgi:hypothetical protein
MELLCLQAIFAQRQQNVALTLREMQEELTVQMPMRQSVMTKAWLQSNLLILNVQFFLQIH